MFLAFHLTQDRPKMAPKPSQDGPRSTQEHQRSLQEASRSAKMTSLIQNCVFAKIIEKATEINVFGIPSDPRST